MNKMSMILVVAGLMSCTNDSRQQADIATDTTTLAKADASMAFGPKGGPVAPGCFTYVSATDTLLLRIVRVNGSEVSGSLDYRRHKQKSQSGNFMGTLQGDTLLANYSYLSGGKRAVREVAFLRSGDGWKEGTGPQSGKEVKRFSDPGVIRFGQTTYLPAGCP